MRSNLKKYLSPALLLSAISFLTAAAPVKNDMVELTAFLHGRSEAKFRDSDNNKLVALKPGTKAIVDEVKHFESGNYGVCLRVVTTDEGKSKNCFWVHHIPRSPTIRFYNVAMSDSDKEVMLNAWKTSEKVDTVIDLKQSKAVIDAKQVERITEAKTPEAGQVSVVVRKTPAIPVPKVASEKAAAKAAVPAKELRPPSDGIDAAGSREIIESTLKKAGEMNSINSLMAPTPPKDPCNGACAEKTLVKEETCTSKNSYLQKEIAQLSTDPTAIVTQLLAVDRPSKYIKDNCFNEAMRSSGGPFKYCSPGKRSYDGGKHSVPRACLSKDLKKLTRNAFDLTMNCLGEFLTNDSKTIPVAAQNYFFLLAQESGHNPNAVSTKNAGGSSQLTDPVDEETGRPAGAVSYVNRVEKKLMLSFLSKKNDPLCSPIQQVLNQGMGEGLGKSCDRISISKGNPLLNLVYGLAYQKYLKENVRAYVTENPLNKMRTNGPFSRMQPEAKEYFESQVGQWSHNTGGGGMKKALMAMIQEYSRSSNRVIVTIDDAQAALKDLKRFVRAKTTGRKVEEPTSFWENIQNRKSTIEKNAGGGSCAVESK